MTTLSNTSKLLAIGIILVQIFDIGIHVATDQIELLRITSSIIMIVLAIAIMLGWLTTSIRTASLTSIGLYLLPNLVFLAQNGLTNAHQDDAPRTMLFVLMFITVALAGLLVSRLTSPK